MEKSFFSTVDIFFFIKKKMPIYRVGNSKSLFQDWIYPRMQLASIASATSGFCEYDRCIFCGECTCDQESAQDSEDKKAKDSGRRTKTKSEIANFVQTWCQPTPFLYQALSSMSGKAKVDLCVPCINWYRRCSQGMRKRNGGSKQLLRVDHLILYMIEPGKVLQPDQRCIWRLMKILKSAEESGDSLAWYEVVPVPVQIMLSRVPIKKILEYEPVVDKDVPELLRRSTKEGRVVYDELNKAWYEYNGEPKFFAHSGTAKLMRKYVKDYVDPEKAGSSSACFGEPGFDDEGDEKQSAAALIAELEAALGEERTEGLGEDEAMDDAEGGGCGMDEGFPESASVTQSDANGVCDVNVSRSLEI